MHDLVFAVAGGACLLGAVALAIRVDLDEARAAPPVTPRAGTRRRLRLVRFEG
jgi:hypothetical protein